MIRASGRKKNIRDVVFTRSKLFFTPKAQLSGDFFQQTTAKPYSGENTPKRPVFAPESKVYKEILRPEDACNLFLRPDFTDVAVAALSKDCLISGRSGYQMVSKSGISDSKMMFAFMAIEWMDAVSSAIVDLAPMLNSSSQLRYTAAKREEALANLYNENVWNMMPVTITDAMGRALETTAMGVYIASAALQGISAEKAAAYLVSRSRNDEDIVHLLQYLLAQGTPVFLSFFVTELINHVYANPSPTRLREFLKFFKDHSAVSNSSSHLMADALIRDLEPNTLDKLIYIASDQTTDSGIRLARAALLTLIKQIIAPLEAAFGRFLSAYFHNTQSLTREQILVELAPLKPVFLAVGLPGDAFSVLLNRFTTCIYDLSHLLRTVSRTSPGLLASHAAEIFQRLQLLQKQESVSAAAAEVQAAQIRRLLSGAVSAQPRDCGDSRNR